MACSVASVVGASARVLQLVFKERAVGNVFGDDLNREGVRVGANTLTSQKELLYGVWIAHL